MKQIWTVCNTGFGTSLFVEMNIQDVLKKYKLDHEYEAHHGALYNTDWSLVDVVVVAKDIAPFIIYEKPMVILDSIIDNKELEEKLIPLLGRKDTGG